MPNTEAKWQGEWPTETGFWWLFGKAYKNDKDGWYFVRVNETATPGSFAYITNGHLLYKAEGAGGLWTRVQFPKLQTV